MPTIIFVPGGWHTEFHVRPVVPLLEQLGYSVLPVVLKTSIKSDPPPVLQDNVKQILDAIEATVSKEDSFILVGHSVSGHSTTIAANEFLGTATPKQKALFTHFVWIACFLDSMRLAPHLAWASVLDDAMWVEVNDVHGTFYNDMSTEEAKPYINALEANRAQWPPEFTNLFRELNGIYVLCQNDHAVPPEIQRLEAEENGMRLVEMKADHVPFVSHPEEFAKTFHQAVTASK